MRPCVESGPYWTGGVPKGRVLFMQRYSRLLRFACVAPCVLLGCTTELSSRGDSGQATRQDNATAAQLQVQTAALRTEVDNLRTALLERDRREAELWQGYMTLIARVNQLMQEQQQARSAANSMDDAMDLTALPSQTNRPIAVKALVRAINRLNLTTEQKQSLLQLLSPPRAIDEKNPWTGVGVVSW